MIVMEEEIISKNEPLVKIDGKEYLSVLISNQALSQINKIILGDKVDEDNKNQVKLRKQVHEDCLRLFKEFN